MSDRHSGAPSHTTAYVACNCGSEVISLEWDRDESQVWLALFESRAQGRGSWRQRLRHIWRIVRKGDPWADWAVLDVDQARVLARALDLFLAGAPGTVDET